MISVKKYLDEAQDLVDKGEPTDGCTMPFAGWIHKNINNSKLICAAHDFGSRGLIKGVRPGWHNNVVSFKANRQHGNYLWSDLMFIATLPYALVRYNLGWEIGVAPFHSLLAFIGLIIYLISLG